jgi:tetratricopeptide (TPR) repeat protein
MAINIEEIYLEAEADIKNSAYVEAYKKYETILYEEPNYAPAHNSMGWLLKNQFDDLEKAENHFMAAMKSNPLYPHPYFHYAVLLTDMERYKDLEKHLDKCLKISTIEKPWVNARFGILNELKQNFTEAIGFYEKAILTTLSDEKIKDYKADIERCKMKIELQQKK